MNIKQIWSILRGRRTNFSWMNASWTYYPDGDPISKPKRNEAMSDLISRDALLITLRKERDDYFREHFFQDPATGTYEASNAMEEALEEMDERIEFIENFPAVEPIAKLTNNNQPGWTNIIETKPNVTIDVGTALYAAPRQ